MNGFAKRHNKLAATSASIFMAAAVLVTIASTQTASAVVRAPAQGNVTRCVGTADGARCSFTGNSPIMTGVNSPASQRYGTASGTIYIDCKMAAPDGIALRSSEIPSSAISNQAVASTVTHMSNPGRNNAGKIVSQGASYTIGFIHTQGAPAALAPIPACPQPKPLHSATVQTSERSR